MRNPYPSMSNEELALIAKDILSSSETMKRPESLLPYARELHENLNGADETIVLRECIYMAKNDFYEELCRRFIKKVNP